MHTQENPFQNFEVISSYSREQAIEDGVLVDVTGRANGFGIRFPMVFTESLYETCMNAKEAEEYTDEEGFLKHVIVLARNEMRRAAPGSDRVSFNMTLNDKVEKIVVRVGPGDNMEPVLTVMFPHED